MRISDWSSDVCSSYLNALRYTKHMADKACHVFGSTTHVGLTQALCLTQHPCRLCGHLQLPVCGVVRAAESALLIQVTAHGLRSKLLAQHSFDTRSHKRLPTLRRPGRSEKRRAGKKGGST